MDDVSAARLARYNGAIHTLNRALRAAEADTDAAELDRAVADYLRASDDAFAGGGGTAAAPAVLGGDLRVLGELAVAGDAADGMLPVGASHQAGFLDDMAVVTATIAGRPPEPVLVVSAGDDEAADAVASINTIVGTGLETLGGVVAATVFPHVTELPQIVSGVFGAAAGEAVAVALSAIQSKVGAILRAVTSVLKSIVDKLVGLLGQPAVDQLTDWVRKVVGVRDVYEAALGVPGLRKATATLEMASDSTERVRRIATIAESHERCQTWVSWGARGLGWAGPKLAAVHPWGPVAVAGVSVVLVTGCAWLTADHLDSYDVRWLPDRFDGVGSVLA